MKKVISLLLIIVLISSFSITAFATDGESGDGEDDNSSLIGIIIDGFQSVLDGFFPSPVIEDEDGQLDVANASTSGFDAIASFLVGSDSVFMFIDGTRIASVLLKVFTPLGYLVLFTCWGFRVAKEGLDLDLYDGKKTVEVLVSLIAGLMVMSISQQILLLISDIALSATKEIVIGSNIDIVEHLGTSFNSIEMYENDIPFVGWMLQLINFMRAQGPLLAFNILTFIVAIIMSISLGIRLIKLAIYQGTSPVFFGMMASDSTNRFFVNFIVQYCVIAFQIVIMAAIYTAFQISFVNAFTSNEVIGNFTWSSFLYGTVMSAVFMIMMLKSDKLFDRVFH